jgi:PAS domain S-box-containing protein
MSQPLRVLIVDDSADDAELILFELQRAGFEPEWRRVDTEADYLASLDPGLDVILSDYRMPQFDGLKALALLHQSGVDVPFILISGTIGEDTAVAAMREGAVDYLLKDRLTRLGPSVQRALDQTRLRKEREQAEKAMQQSEHKYRHLFENLGEAAFLIDEGSRRIIDTNRCAEELLGRTRAEICGMDERKLFPADQPALATLGSEGETAIQTRDGRTIPVRANIAPVTLHGRQLVLALLSNISGRKASESAMAAQISRMTLLQEITRAIARRLDLQSIFHVALANVEEHLPVDFGCICLYEAGMLTVRAVGPRSRAVAELLGLPEQAAFPLAAGDFAALQRGELISETDLAAPGSRLPASLAHGGMHAVVLAPLVVEGELFGVLATGRHRREAFGAVDREFLRQLGEHVALAAHQAQLHGALRTAYEELRHTQEIAMQQERLKALGQMASGIAHDINNAICVVGIYAELLLANEPNLSEDSRESLRTMERAIQDVAHTVSRLREFYRKGDPKAEFVHVPLQRVAEEIRGLTRARWSDMPQQRGVVIDFHTELTAALPEILGIESEIREALTNLIFNAVDSMPEGGTLTLRTGLHQRPQGPRVGIEVADTGTGMDEETRGRCLEPFFTTKGPRGTGLGLAMVCGVAQRHQAEIEIVSAPGRGTTVRLLFPVPATPASLAAPVAEVAAPVHRRILVIDDEPAISRALCLFLEADGHTVTTAANGEAGLKVFHAALASGEPFDVVVTDLGMPGMDGTKVATAVKAVAPSTPVIMITGWGQAMIEEHNFPVGVDHVITKPPRLRDVRAALAAVLPA